MPRQAVLPAGRLLGYAADALPYLGARVLTPGDMMGGRVFRRRCDRSLSRGTSAIRRRQGLLGAGRRSSSLAAPRTVMESSCFSEDRVAHSSEVVVDAPQDAAGDGEPGAFDAETLLRREVVIVVR